jgi:PAS domain S-box-containing protein
MTNIPDDSENKSYKPHNYRLDAELQLKQHPLAHLAEGATNEKILHELQVHQIELEMQNEELRHAQVALEISRDRYLDLFEFAPIGYFTLTDKGLIEDVNFVGAELLGIERKKLLSRPFSRYVTPEYSDKFYLRLASLLAGDNRQSYDMQIKREDSSLLYVHVDAVRILAEGEALTLRITLTNINENRRLQESLRATKDYLDGLIEHANGPIIVWDAACKIVKVNQAVCKLTGLRILDLMGRPIHYLFSDENQQYVSDMVQRTIQGEHWEALELSVKNSAGELRIISWNTATLYNSNGSDVRVVVAQGQDATERKQAEQDLRIAAIAFQAQEGIFVTDVNSNILRANEAFSRMIGYSIDELVGKPASIINSGLHDSDFFKSMFETIGANRFWQGEIWNKRKNGEVFPGLMTVATVVGEDTFSIRYVGTLLDITVQKQAEKVLSEARMRLERQVKKVVRELSTLKGESDEMNTALKVMMKMRQSENSEAKDLLTIELKQEVMPFLERLKVGNKDIKQLRLINTLEANLHRLISTYGSPTSITSSYKNLTPKEIQVAAMVREGFPSKAIASTLSLSPETISIHRKNIRKKLGLDSRSENLRSYLISNHKVNE